MRTEEYLNIVKTQQETVTKEMDTLAEKYTYLMKISEANESLIKSLEEQLGIRPIKKPKNKNKEEKKGDDIQTLHTTVTYTKESSFSQKAEFALTKENRRMTCSEIVDTIFSVDKSLKEEDKRIYISRMSAILWEKIKNDKIFYREKNDIGDYIYGLKEWKNKEASQV